MEYLPDLKKRNGSVTQYARKEDSSMCVFLSLSLFLLLPKVRLLLATRGFVLSFLWSSQLNINAVYSEAVDKVMRSFV